MTVPPKLADYLDRVEPGATRVERYPVVRSTSSPGARNKGGKIARLVDGSDCFEVRFEQAAIALITIDLNRMEVEKRIGPFAEHHIREREIRWLERLRGSGIAPELRGHSQDLIRMSYVGEPVRQYNLPQDWPDQAEHMLRVLHDHSCCHNDIKCDNLTVLDGRLYLIDFGWATATGEAIPETWPAGIGRQHRLGIHRFDDRHAIHAALASAERDEVDRSIVMAR